MGGSGGIAGATGSTCAANEDCHGGLCLPHPGGYCSADCTTDGCPDDSLCQFVDGAAVCLAPCGGPECRAGYQCFSGACRPACADDGGCGKGFACNGGRCEPLPGTGIGEKCKVNDDCSSRLCDLRTKTCRLGCTYEQQCGAAETCWVNPVDRDGDRSPESLLPICIPRRADGRGIGEPCTKDAECAQGQCELGACVTLCQTGGNCPTSPPMTCAQMMHLAESGTPKFNGCLPRNGTITYDIPTGGDELLPLPSNAQSFSLFVAATGMNVNYYTGIYGLDDPAGTSLYTPPRTRDELAKLPLRYFPSPGTSMVLVSNAPARLQAKPGLYGFKGFAQAQGGGFSDYSTRVRIKVGEGGAAGPVNVALHVFVTNLSGGCTSFNAASAPKALAAVETQIKSIFAKAWVNITSITYKDTTASSTFTQDQGDNTELMNILRKATTGDDPDVLELVIVKKISGGQGGGFEILGVAGGIPASVGVPGTPHSGVTASLTSLCWDKTGKQMATTIAHELGHSLGLFHNIEQDASTDAITDNDADREQNLMYWAENNRGNQVKLSGQQAQVMRNNPALK